MTEAASPRLVAVRVPAGRGWLDAVDTIWQRGDAILPLPVDAPDTLITTVVETLRPAAVVDLDGETPVDGGAAVPGGTAAVVTTSGSTGAPKGVILTHAALQASAAASLRRLDAGPADRWLCCVPLHHVAGLQVIVRSRLLGVPPVVHGEFSVDAVARQRDITMVSLVPTMLRRLLDARVDLGHLRRVLLGGATASATLLRDASAAGVPVVTTYGMTETSGGCVYDGVPLDGVALDVDADGRIWIGGDVLFTGYRFDDAATAAALRGGRLRTQDLGRWSADGRLEVLGRADDVIVTGGENVPAAWVAGVVEGHPGVREAAVVGRSHPLWGEEVVAVVVAADPGLSGEQVRAFAGQRLPRHAVPKAVIVVSELPRLDSGKVDRLALRTLADT